MQPLIDPRLFSGLSTYQDVVVAGRTVRQGTRDCAARWKAIAPYVSAAGSVLDVGSNFGWFGLKACEDSPHCVVLSVEGDERSARVQRRVLQLNRSERICLLVRKMDSRLAADFARVAGRFDAVLCLSVLHWIRDHRQVLSALGAISTRLLIEHPEAEESGAGVRRIREEIGPIGPYLKQLFPQRPVRCIAAFPSYRDPRYSREMWLVDAKPDAKDELSSGLDVATLMKMTPSWPPRSWWRRQLEPWSGLTEQASTQIAAPRFSGAGLEDGDRQLGPVALGELRRQLQRLPEDRLLSPERWCSLRTRRLAGAALRGLRLRS